MASVFAVTRRRHLRPMVEEMAMSLKLGDTVPDFSQDSIEGTLNFYGWAGSDWLVLFSHSKEYTPVCATELGSVALSA